MATWTSPNFIKYPNDSDFHNMINSKRDGPCHSGLQVKALVHHTWCGLSTPSGEEHWCSRCLFPSVSSTETPPVRERTSAFYTEPRVCCVTALIDFSCVGVEIQGLSPLHGKASEHVCVPSTIETIFQLTGPGLLSVCAALQNMVFPVNWKYFVSSQYLKAAANFGQC